MSQDLLVNSLKGTTNPRENRPPAAGKTNAGCERTWKWINTCICFVFVKLFLPFGRYDLAILTRPVLALVFERRKT